MFKVGRISELSMMGPKMTSNGRLISYTVCPKNMFCYERGGKSELLQIEIFLATVAGNFFRVSSRRFMLVFKN